ncbi:MAG: hypothetical protein WC569_05635 [Candidatus Omnitrophota bacterium]
MEGITPEGKLLDLIKKDQVRKKLSRELRIFTKINIALGIIIAALGVVFLLDIFVFKKKAPGVPLEAKVVIPDEPQTPIAAAETEPEKTREFSGEETSEKERAVILSEIKANLNLLGIITGDNSQAIIEDKALKKTFFLYKGDRMGTLKVGEIRDNMVILDLDGEKIELTM